jgi:hypothetical protein
MQQSLTDVDKSRKFSCCDSFHQYLEFSPAVVHHIWFTDEAYFHLNWCVTEQNIHVWGTETPHTIMEMPLHPRKCMVCCTISSAGIVSPFFLHDTVSAEHCHKLLQDHFVPSLQGIKKEKVSCYMPWRCMGGEEV